ncbi:MAG: 50S ribosomal protein L24 [Candidatus Solibacter usitatus]|nr:50S ribosomal protein L24 [Candidatus Solibacter usitatus]
MAGRLANRHNQPKEVVKTKIKKNDTVKVISGRDKGKVGRVLEVNRESGRVLVEGVMMSKKHVKPNPAKGVKGGIAEREAAIHVSNVMMVTSDGKTTRVGMRVETVGGKPRRVRIARRTGESLDGK